MGNINTFVCLERQSYCFTSLRLIVQITACFSVDIRKHTQAFIVPHGESFHVLACVCVCVRVSQLCAGTAHSALIDLLNGRRV